MSNCEREKTDDDRHPIWTSRRRKPNDGVWFLGSLLFHLGIVGLLLLTPARELILSSDTDDADQRTLLREQEVQEIAEHVRRREELALKEKLEALKQIEEELAQAADEKLSQLQTLSQTPQEQARDFARQAVEQQHQAQELQKAAAQAKAAEQISPDEVRDIQKQAQDAQAKAEELQQKAAEAIRKALADGAKMEKTAELQTQAIASQAQASQKQTQAAKDDADADAQASAMEAQQQATTAQSEVHQQITDELAAQAAERVGAMTEIVAGASTRAKQAQQKAIEAQQQAETAQDKHADAQTAEARQQAREAASQAQSTAEQAQQQAHEAQMELSKAQHQAEQALKEAGDAYQQAASIQDQATAAQTRANDLQDDARRKQDAASDAEAMVAKRLKELTDAEKRAADRAKRFEDATREKQKAEELLERRKKELAKRREQLQEAEQKQAEASDAYDAATAAAKQVDKKDAKQKKAADVKVRRTQRKLKQAKEHAARVVKALKRDESELKRAETILEKKAETFEKRQSDARETQRLAAQKRRQVEQALADARARQGEATAVQKQAAEAQDEATAAMQAVVEAVVAARADQAGEADEQMAQAPPEEPQPQSIAEVYDRAAETEQAISQTYRAYKAAERAMTTGEDYTIALNATVVPVTQRPEVDRTLLDAPTRTAEQARILREEIGKVRSEMDSMVAAAYQLKEMTASQPGGVNVSLDALRAETARQKEMQALATENVDARYADLTALMKGEGLEGKQAAQPGAPAGGGDQGGGQGEFKTEKPPAGMTALKVESYGKVQAIPGRKVLTSAAAATPKDSWMYVDTWYTIGPFPNPERRNINKAFPPETVVDLDATYVGKGGRKVRWQFVQSPQAGISPARAEEYAIYYAYTELWFEQATDAVIAVGSDDNSRLWINGQMVWRSGDELKSWRADEGYRRVHFRKGLNRILCRVENGWHACMFSLLVHIGPMTDL